MTLGFVNFGGPAGQIAIMHRELVERRGWVTEQRFLRALNVCMLLPGPEAQQLATWIGWHLHGIRGGLAAGAFFVMPSVVVLLILSWLVAAHGEAPLVEALLYGVQPVVVAIVLDALVRIGRRTLRHAALATFAASAYVALQVFAVPFPLVVLAAGLAGWLLRRRIPSAFGAQGDPRVASAAGPGLRRAVRISAIFVALWAVPVGALWAWRGAADVLVHEALFFTQAAFVTFGGAYAVLAFISEAAVESFGWLTAEQMVQGLGLAESTPGPLIMVTQYVGSLAAWYGHPEAPLLYLVLGGLVTTYVTFLPSFFMILLAAPYVERLSEDPRIQAALTGVTAAIVGVIARLAAFFGASVLVDGTRVDLFALALAGGSFVALRSGRLAVPLLVALGAIAGALWRLAAL